MRNFIKVELALPENSAPKFYYINPRYIACIWGEADYLGRKTAMISMAAPQHGAFLVFHSAEEVVAMVEVLP